MPKPLVPDELWQIVQPLLPAHKDPRRRRSRFRRGGRPPVDDRAILGGILFVMRTGIPWKDLPAELNCGSGMTCWRRLRDWQQAGVWNDLHQQILTKLNAAGAIDWSRAAVDGSHVRALLGGLLTGPPRSIAPAPAQSTTSSSTPPASHWPSR